MSWAEALASPSSENKRAIVPRPGGRASRRKYLRRAFAGSERVSTGRESSLCSAARRNGRRIFCSISISIALNKLRTTGEKSISGASPALPVSLSTSSRALCTLSRTSYSTSEVTRDDRVALCRYRHVDSPKRLRSRPVASFRSGSALGITIASRFRGPRHGGTGNDIIDWGLRRSSHNPLPAVSSTRYASRKASGLRGRLFGG